MKDQNTINVEESQDQKWNRGLDLYIESVQKPDHQLRSCAHNQKCFNELMAVREHVLEYVKTNHRITKKQMEALNKVHKRCSEDLFNEGNK